MFFFCFRELISPLTLHKTEEEREKKFDEKSVGPMANKPGNSINSLPRPIVGHVPSYPTIHLCGVGQNAQVCTREQQQHATLHEKSSCPILTARAIQVQPPFRYPMDVREEHCQWEIQQQQNITWLHETPIRQRRAPRQLLSSQTSSP